MKIETTKIFLIIMGATGFWKFVELLLQFGTLKRLKKAEARNLDIQANHLVVENWVQWSEKMEKRIAELESKNTEMSKVISKQKERINELQKYVDQLEEEIKKYKK